MRLAIEVDPKGGFIVQGDAAAANRLAESAAVFGGLLVKALNVPVFTVRPAPTVEGAKDAPQAKRGPRARRRKR